MRAIYTCDIGNIRKGNFGWSRCVREERTNPTGSTDISKLVVSLLRDMGNEKSIALGFECRLFMPVPPSADDLSKGRQGEGARAMFAQAGAAVNTLGVHQAAWILRKIHQSGAGSYQFTTETNHEMQIRKNGRRA